MTISSSLPTTPARRNFSGWVWLIPGLPIFTLWFAHTWFVPVYQSNDDVIWEMLVRGIGFCDQPSPYLIIPNILIGRSLVFLYQQYPNVPWYRLCMNGIHLAASVALMISFLSWRRSWGKLLFLSLYFLVFDFHYYVRPQFTTVAFLAAQAAILVWWTGIRDGRDLTGTRFLFFLLFLGASALIRSDSALLALLIALPGSFLLAAGPRVTKPPGVAFRKWFLHLGLPVLTGLSLVLFLRAYNYRQYEGNQAWQGFYSFHEVRIKFMDYSYAPQDAAVYDEVGWSENDVSLIKKWFFPDPTTFNQEKVSRVVAQTSWRDLAATQEAFKYFWFFFANDPWTKAMFGSLIFSLLFQPWSKANLALQGVTLFGVAGMLLFLLFVLHRLLPRVYEPLFGFVFLTGILGVEKTVRAGWSRPFFWIRTVGFVILIILIVVFYMRMLAESRDVQILNRRFLAALNKLNPKTDQLYLAWAEQLPYELLLTGRDLSRLRQVKLVNIGFLTQSPYSQKRFREFGIADPFRALFENDHVFVFSNPPWNDLLIRYVQEHYGIAIKAEPIHEESLGLLLYHPRVIRVYRFTRA